MILQWDIFYRAYRQFCGNFVDTGNLENFDPSFSREKHYCNCTFAFMLLERAGLADGIVKRGVENTIRCVGLLASEGMQETDKEIVKLMIQNNLA